MSVQIKPVVLCGGSGTRLWPLSKPDHPKQFLSLLGEKTMLGMTLDRVRQSALDSLSFSTPLVIGSQRHGDLIDNLASRAEILLEPMGRNSAAPVAAAALASQQDELLLVLPADHDIADVDAFHQAVSKGAAAASDGSVVTFGIIAATPETGYGYIEAASSDGAVIDVVRFVEKPDRPTAETYVASGKFFWNAGIFLFRAGDMLAAFEAHAPDILDSVKAAMPDSFNGQSDARKGTLGQAAFDTCRSESIDYAIIEHHRALKVVPVDMGWSDIGDFRALWERSPKDENGNVIIGNVTAVDCRNCYIRAENRTISVAGQDNTVMVATADDFMICDMNSVQAVKALAKA